MRKKIRLALPSSESSDTLINLTPLIDVVFVMLIMFIIVVPMLNLEQVELSKSGPKSEELPPSVPENAPITLHVRRDNTILFNKHPVSLAGLKPLLKEARELFPKSVPLLFHDKQAYFGTYQEIKNMLEEAGFSEVDLVLNP